MPKKLSFEDFEEEIEGPKEKKVEKVKVEKVKVGKDKGKPVKTTPAKPKSPAPKSTPAPATAAPKSAPAKVVSPSTYFKTASASKRHSWTWAEYGKKATCSRPGCKASMNWAAGKRGGIVHFYLIEGDPSPRQVIPGCPCARVEGKAKK